MNDPGSQSPGPPSPPPPPPSGLSVSARHGPSAGAAPAPGPPPAPRGPYPGPPPRGSTGFARSLGAFLTALGVLVGVFLLGIGAGILLLGMMGFWMAGSELEALTQWSRYRDGDSKVVAVLPISGMIDQNQAVFVRSCVRDILERDTVEAVVIRVNSGGGGATASDEIWHEIDKLKQAGLPVLASFGSAAASGGYYVACGADHITAQETTITGSIGVIAQVMTMEGLMDKIGVEPVTLVARRSPEKSVANDTFRAWNEADRAQVIMMLDAAYDTFRRRVEQGRGAALAEQGDLAEIANGSIFTAAEASRNGLVDAIGYLDDAVASAEQRAGLAAGSATVMMLSRRPTLLGSLMSARSGPASGRDLLDAERLRSFVNELASVRLMYLMHAR